MRAFTRFVKNDRFYKRFGHRKVIHPARLLDDSADTFERTRIDEVFYSSKMGPTKVKFVCEAPSPFACVKFAKRQSRDAVFKLLIDCGFRGSHVRSYWSYDTADQEPCV